MIKSPYVTAMYENDKEYGLIISDIQRYVRAFRIIHNHDLADEMEHLAKRLEKAAAKTLKIMSDRIDVDFKQAQEGTANILKAFVAGAGIDPDSLDSKLKEIVK